MICIKKIGFNYTEISIIYIHYVRPSLEYDDVYCRYTFTCDQGTTLENAKTSILNIPCLKSQLFNTDTVEVFQPNFCSPFCHLLIAQKWREKINIGSHPKEKPYMINSHFFAKLVRQRTQWGEQNTCMYDCTRK